MRGCRLQIALKGIEKNPLEWDLSFSQRWSCHHVYLRQSFPNLDNRGPLHRRSAHTHRTPHTIKCVQVNRKNIIPVVKDIIKQLWKELIRLHSVEGQPTKAVLAQTCMGAFFILSFPDIILLFFPKQSADRLGPPVVHGPQYEKHWSMLWWRVDSW
jgi:hypothetical protein